MVIEEEHRPAAGQHHNHLRAHQPYRSKPTQAPKHRITGVRPDARTLALEKSQTRAYPLGMGRDSLMTGPRAFGRHPRPPRAEARPPPTSQQCLV